MLEKGKYYVTLKPSLWCLKAFFDDGFVLWTSGEPLFLSCHSISRRTKPKTKLRNARCFAAFLGSWNWFWENEKLKPHILANLLMLLVSIIALYSRQYEIHTLFDLDKKIFANTFCRCYCNHCNQKQSDKKLHFNGNLDLSLNTELVW